VSRSHLSRAFRAEAGETLTQYRAHLRVRAALDRLEAGETSLATLAAELGFADHAHLTRTMHAQLGNSTTSTTRSATSPWSSHPIHGRARTDPAIRLR
jgi:AraC-like DNA-binding protein